MTFDRRRKLFDWLFLFAALGISYFLARYSYGSMKASSIEFCVERGLKYPCSELQGFSVAFSPVLVFSLCCVVGFVLHWALKTTLFSKDSISR